ncbi:MAG: transglutaminase-like domain-containing protein [Candidatus Kariarchaeaceae archaeon]
MEKFAKSYDPHYEEKVVYKDEPGLELSLLPEEIGKEFPDRRYPVLVIKEVHKKIHSEMRYVVQEKERGLSYALRYRRGDCTEYSAYFCSVLRKLGIKARICHGFARSYHNNWISHAFVEVMIFGVWIPVDVMKSPEAIRIGNYGDLIKISHHNWLDSERGRVKVKYTSRGKVKLNMKYQQKVSESGLKNIKKSARVLPEMYKTTITFEKLIDTFNNLTNNGILLILEGDLMATIHTIVMDNGASVPSKTDFQDGVQYFGRIIDNKGEHLFSCRIRRDNSS